MASSELKFVISAADHASDVLGKVGKNVDGLSKKTKMLADTGRMLGAGAILAFGAASIKAYAEAEKSQVKLQEAYRKFPAVADVSIQSMRELNSAIQAKTGTDDDELAAAEAKLAMYNLTGSQIRDLIPLVNDFAVAQGIGVTDAAGQVGKAMMGNTRALKALGIDYKVTGDRAKDFENIMGLLEEKVGGAGDAFGQTTAGQMQILQASFSDLQEEVGAQLVPALQALVGIATPILNAFGKLPQPVKATAVMIGAAAAATLLLLPRLITVGTALRGVFPAAMSAVAGFRATGEAATVAATQAQAAGSRIGLAMRGIGIASIALVGVGSVLSVSNDKLAETFAKQDEELSNLAKNGNLDEAKQKLLKLAETMGITQDQIPVAFPKMAEELGLVSTATDAAGVATAGLAEYLESGGAAAGEAGEKLGDFQEVAKDTWDVTKELTKATNDLKIALDQLGGKAISVDGATAGLQAAYDDAAEAAKTLREETDKAKDAVIGNGSALDLSTEAGRTAQSALEGIATKADDVATAMDSAGASTAKIRDKMITARDEFVKNAEKMGLTRQAAERLADKYGLIPDRIATEVQVKKDAEAKAKAEELRRLYGSVPGHLYTYTSLPTAETAIATAGRVRGAIVSIPRTWTTTLVVVDQNGNNARLPRARGGYVRGAGTGTSDSIPANLSNGEYVIRAASVARAGVAFLDDLNDNGMIDNVAITAGGRAIVSSARDRAQAQSAEFWSHTVLQVDGKQLAESLVKYKRSIGNAPLGVS